MSLAAGKATRAMGERIGDLLLDFLDGALMHQRPDVGLVVKAIAGPQRLDPLGEGSVEAIVDRPLDVDAVGGAVRLRVEGHRPDARRQLNRAGQRVRSGIDDRNRALRNGAGDGKLAVWRDVDVVNRAFDRHRLDVGLR